MPSKEIDSEPKKRALIVAGPTGSGKTSLGIRLAQELNGEIINADSRQVYRGLDIGTGKGVLEPTGEFIRLPDIELRGYELEHSGVTGWLFDLLDPDQGFDVSRFYRYAGELLELIHASGKTPVIVGGTGLYLDALIKGYRLPQAKPDSRLRTRLAKMSIPELQTELEQLAPQRFTALNNSDRNNPRRLMRAIEIARQPDTSQDQYQLPNLGGWKFCLLYPIFERQALFKKITDRVAQMFKAGMIAETRQAIKNGYGDTEVLNGFSYQEVQKFLRGELTKAEALALAQQESRNYAKRQITWFTGKGRKYKLHRFDFAAEREEIVEFSREFLYA